MNYPKSLNLLLISLKFRITHSKAKKLCDTNAIQNLILDETSANTQHTDGGYAPRGQKRQLNGHS